MRRKKTPNNAVYRNVDLNFLSRMPTEQEVLMYLVSLGGEEVEALMERVEDERRNNAAVELVAKDMKEGGSSSARGESLDREASA